MRGGAAGAEMRGGRRPAGLACIVLPTMPGGVCAVRVEMLSPMFGFSAQSFTNS